MYVCVTLCVCVCDSRLSTRGLKKLRRSGEKCVDTLVTAADLGGDFHNNTKHHAVFHYPYFLGLLGAWTNLGLDAQA